MALVKKPLSNQMLPDSNQITAEQQAFISRSQENDGKPAPVEKAKTVPVMIRIDPDMLERVDRAAKRLGLKRAPFLIVSAVEKLERMQQD